MKTIQEFLQEKLKPINFDELLTVGKVSLTEAGPGDPFGNTGGMGGAGGAGATDPFGTPTDGDQGLGGAAGTPFAPDDPGMSTPTDAPADDDAGFENAETDEDEEKEDDHEDDPDWTKGVKDSDNVMLDDKPAGESIYDGESVIKSIAAVRASKSPEELKSIDEVQKALELIVNGKKLKFEDVAFEDPDDAMELISAIEEPLDIKLRNYIDLKIKQPIIAYRDKNKAEIAKAAADNDKARDTIDAMNKQTK